MIVKNESKIITRLFDSVISIIDYYCISDTGSTDNTIEIIENYFKKAGKPGKIINTGSFTNFAYNRNIALKACLDFPADYILLLDADMYLKIGKGFSKDMLIDDCYNIFQGCSDFYYQNIRIIRNHPENKYIGVTHEYIFNPKVKLIVALEKELLFIEDIGDGGAKADKYERDIRLLTQGLIEEPENEVRYLFYLAGCYFDIRNYDKAIEFYKKRIVKEGWKQEVWYSWYRIGKCYAQLRQEGEMLDAWLCAWEILPDRLENVWHIIGYYRSIGKHKVAFSFFQLIKDKSLYDDRQRDQHLFLENDVYAYNLRYEWCLLAYYNGITDISEEAVSVLNNTTSIPIFHSLLDNLRFYPMKLDPLIILDIGSQISGIPCISNYGDGYVVNVSIKGTDSQKAINKLIHINKKLDTWKTTQILPLDIEDIRLFNNGTKFTGSIVNTASNIRRVVCGSYPNFEDLKEVKMNKEHFRPGNEKNWAFYTDKQGKQKVVYLWFPLIICELNDTTNTLDIVRTDSDDIPHIFYMARGSSSGYTFNDEIWFMVHHIAQNPCTYYHILAVFDLDMNLKRYTAPFKLTDSAIEKCFGIIVEDTRVILSYGSPDRKFRSIVAAFSKETVETLLKYRSKKNL